jgi:hypothetical protein
MPQLQLLTLRWCTRDHGCDAFGFVQRAVAMHRAPKTFVEERRRNPVIRPSPKSTLGRVMLTRRPLQIADVREEPDDVLNIAVASEQIPTIALMVAGGPHALDIRKRGNGVTGDDIRPPGSEVGRELSAAWYECDPALPLTSSASAGNGWAC